MRTVLVDPQGCVVDPAYIPTFQMLPVECFVTKAPGGEVVMVARIDTRRAPENLWNPAVLK